MKRAQAFGFGSLAAGLVAALVGCGSSESPLAGASGASGNVGMGARASSTAAAGASVEALGGGAGGPDEPEGGTRGSPIGASGAGGTAAGNAGLANGGVSGSAPSASSGGGAGSSGSSGSSGSNGGGAGGSSGGASAFDRAAVSSLMRRVADYEIARFGTTTNNDWVRAVFHTGMLAAYRALGDAKYHDYTEHWGQANNWQLHVDADGVRFADNQACVQSYAELYLEGPTSENAKFIAAAQTTLDAMVAAPKAGRVEWWWCDSLFMAPAAFARVAEATGKTQYTALMDDMFWDTKAYLFDPAQSLFWRDKTYLNTNTYWARGNGWVVGGIARVLDALPATDTRRGRYETLLTQMATKLRAIQASDGFWRSSLTQPTAFTTPESSGTAFFCYGIAWGIAHGVLDRAAYLPTVTRAWVALGTAVNAQGRLGWVQAVGKEPGPSTADSTNDYASGALLLAGEQLLKI